MPAAHQTAHWAQHAVDRLTEVMKSHSAFRNSKLTLNHNPAALTSTSTLDGKLINQVDCVVNGEESTAPCEYDVRIFPLLPLKQDPVPILMLSRPLVRVMNDRVLVMAAQAEKIFAHIVASSLTDGPLVSRGVRACLPLSPTPTALCLYHAIYEMTELEQQLDAATRDHDLQP